MKLTRGEGMDGMPRRELNIDLIGAPQRVLRAQQNGNYSKKYNRKKSKNATCLQIRRVQQGSRKD